MSVFAKHKYSLTLKRARIADALQRGEKLRCAVFFAETVIPCSLRSRAGMTARKACQGKRPRIRQSRIARLQSEGYAPPTPPARKFFDALAVALTPLACLALLEGFTRGSAAAVVKWAISRPEMLALNYLPLLGVSMCLAFIVRYRARALCVLAFALLCALYGIINRYKLAYRAEPILFTDVTQLGDAMATVTGLDFKIDYTQLAVVGLVFAALMALAVVYFKGRRPTRPLLAPIIGLALALAPLLYTFELAGGGRIDISDHAGSEGSLYTAMAMENNRRALMRPDYDEAEVRGKYRELMERAPKASAEAAKPNLIVVLSESFTDEAFLGKYLSLTDTLMPYYDALQAECEHGRIYVPKVGGGTSETEFEVLTGLRSRYSINPYSMGLPPISSLASTLRERGYTSTAIHWYAGVYYNRYHNLKMEGFGAFYTTDTTSRDFERMGMFVSDSEHFSSILSQIRKTDTPDFVFCLTMQNHGGYAYDDFRTRYGADTPFTNELSDGAALIAANYCYLLRQSDAALCELVEGLRELKEPTVLVYFGDHLPPLGAEVCAELQIPTTGREAHMTPYFIWSNYETLAGGGDMYAYELGARALDIIGMDDDPYFAEVERVRAESAGGGAGADGSTDGSSLTGDGDGSPSERANLDLLGYDALFGKQYAYDEGGLSPECEDFQAGGEMRLSGFDAAVIDDAVYLRPRLEDCEQTYTLYANGRACAGFVLPSDKELTLQCVMQNSNGRVFNKSAALSYASTDELLQKSGELKYAELPLWDVGYKQSGDPSRGTVVYVSEKPLYSGFAAATMDGERLQMQPAYAVRDVGQIGLDADGYVYIALKAEELEREADAKSGANAENAASTTSEAAATSEPDSTDASENAATTAIQSYLKQHSAILYCFTDNK